MQLVHVIPIVRGGSRDRLTYFSAVELSLGSLVSIPLRKKTVRALVVKTEELADAKLEVRQASFTIRKLPRQKPLAVLSAAYIEAAERVALLSASNLGAVLYALVPNVILSRTTTAPHIPAAPKRPETKNPKLAYQAPRDERFETYRALIREEFARGNSVFLMVPAIALGQFAALRLSRGIETYVFFLHAGLPKKELLARSDAAVSTEHPVLIIATGSFLSLPRLDVGTIIIEQEGSSNYRTIAGPRIDLRLAAEALSETLHRRCIFADFPLSLETLWRFRHGELDELSPLKLRPQFESTTTIADLHTPAGVAARFEVFGSALQECITRAQAAKKSFFLFCARRGIAPITVCQDCQTAVTCHTCKTPVVVHKSTGRAFASPAGLGENVFFCHRCKSTRSAKERCENCRSWRLISLGIGIERVEGELRRLYPQAQVLRLDRDSATTHKQALTTVEKFYREEGAILLGTEMALQYLFAPVPYTAVVSLDSLLSLPEWRISEKVFSLLIRLRELAQEKCIIQTRRADNYLITTGASGNIPDFYGMEIKLREEFRYPPLFTLVRVSLPARPTAAARAKAAEELQKLEPLFTPHKFELFETRGTVGAVHALARLPQGHWPDEKLSRALAALPPQYSVRINPESLFQ